MKESELLVYSGRNRPDLGPAYRLFEALTGVKVKVERIYRQEVGARLLRDAGTPEGDLLITNGQLAVERLRPAGLFDPYAAPVARDCPECLRASDFSWLPSRPGLEWRWSIAVSSGTRTSGLNAWKTSRTRVSTGRSHAPPSTR